MIAVDTSAIVSVLEEEADAERVRARLAEASGALISTGTLLELQIVAAGHGRNNWIEVEEFLDEYRITPRAFDGLQLRLAREAVLQFGKGRHRARLNFGDCFAYALAKAEGLPLLCVGSDFAHTDVEIA